MRRPDAGQSCAWSAIVENGASDFLFKWPVSLASHNAKADTGSNFLWIVHFVLEHPFCKDLSRNFSNVSARTDRLLAPSFSSSTSFEKAARAPAQAKMKFPNEHTQEVKKWVIGRIENM
jgi:hypothetical protein